ncbi:diphosphomevalonate decarboxylase [Candidatus Woesearchaeota archaeon]|nr:diphosphomevalonate decarboxylase [Candidatus Woesearchaeota archaeon]
MKFSKQKATAKSSSNIAFVKYWGKKDTEKNIPMNPSISMTLDDNLSTKTTVEFSESYKEDILILNNEPEFGDKLKRVSAFLDIIREKSDSNLKAKVVSVNSFPTGSGIASSASGFAALAAASARALELDLSSQELSALARLGSGSASRSIQGGFCEWSGEYAVQLFDENHWPELRDIVVIVSKEEKKISSRDAMKLTVETSSKYKERIENIEKTLEGVRTAIKEKNFPKLAMEIMKDSDNMHACIKDTTPSIDYLNDNSYEIKRLIKELNKEKVIAAYTFDAGPNTHIITTGENAGKITKKLKSLKNTTLIISGVGKGIRYTEKHLF